MYDYTSAFGPGRRGMNAMGAAAIEKDLKKVAIVMAIFNEAERLINEYRDVLRESEISSARMLCWGRESAEDYRGRFLVNVLLNNHQLGKVDDSVLSKRRNAIEKNNPEWLNSFDRAIARRNARKFVKNN